MIPDEPRTVMDSLGICFGTPAITTRGFKEGQCARVAELMVEVLKNKDDADIKKRVRNEVKELALAFPIPDFHF